MTNKCPDLNYSYELIEVYDIRPIKECAMHTVHTIQCVIYS